MEEALLKLDGNKKIEIALDTIVHNLNIDNELDFIEVDVEEKGVLYEKLTLIKGEIYPIPKPNDILTIKEIFIDFDKYLTLRIFIKGELKTLNNNNISSNNPIKFSFSNTNIINSLKSICQIKEELYSSIFKINSLNDKYYSLNSLKDLGSYQLPTSIFPSLLKDDFILIANYAINQKEIIKTNLTIIKKLSEEQLFQFFYKPDIFGNKLTLFKVIDINEKYYIVINNKKELYQIIKNERINALGLKLCQLFFLNKFRLIYNLNLYLNEIDFKNDSIIFISQQDIYFSKLIPINFISVINIYFLDYKINNFYNKVIIGQNNYLINGKEIYCVLDLKKNDFDYYPVEIILQNSDNDNKQEKIFNFFLYNGLLNKINAFANYNLTKAYFIEYFYMSIDIPINELNLKTNVEIDNIQYELKYYDSFNSENRQRINVLNVPYQKINNFEEKEIDNINSIQICNIFNKKKNIIFGIFNIKEVNSKETNIDNSYFDEYYTDFGNIVSIIEKREVNNIDLKDICVKIYTNSKIDKSEKSIFSVYNNELTYSQYKTRLGALICYYLNKCEELYQIYYFFMCFHYFKKSIESTNITFLQRLRIFIFYFRKKFEDANDKIIFFSKLSENSPYVLAKELNQKELNHLTEFSRFFCAYLQLDSYILYNYYKSAMSFSFSLELLFIMRHSLLSNYEDFIFITNERSDEYAYLSDNESITVINSKSLFINIYQSEDENNDIKESKNVALPISFEFRYHKNFRQKRNNKNYNNLSPVFFYRDGKIQKIEDNIKYRNVIIEKGEGAKIIESFLSDNIEIILELKNVQIFGELLDYKYYIEKDFSKLLKKMEEIRKEKDVVTKYGNLSCCKLYDKIAKFRAKRKEEISESYSKKLERQGIIKIGDVHYTKEEFSHILENMKKKY